MRRVFVAAVVCAAFLLLAAPAFAGLARQARPGVKPAPAPHVSRKAAPQLREFAPLGARLAGSVSVSGTVYDSSHYTLSGVPMEWWSWSEGEQRWYGDSMTSGVSGAYSASPLATTNGEVWAYPDEDTWWGRTGQAWMAGSSYPIDLYPGRVNITATRGGLWGNFPGMAVDLWGSTAYSYDYKATADSDTTPATVQVEALDGAYTGGSVNFWLDEGMEFPDVLNVTSGTTPSGTVYVDQSDAQSLHWPGAFKYSGKPGATVRVNRVNFPAGWRNAVSGYSDPTGKPSAKYGVKTSQGGASEPVSVKVPATARPGYSYWIEFQHVDASGYYQPLYLETSYQVCTMKPSKTSITKGTRIRVSGIVPTEGHWGSKAGKRKAIVLWYHKGTKGVPTVWDSPKRQGWVPVGGMKSTGTGSYTTPYFKVPATGTFVVQYDTDNWYFGGFTSTAKVTVR